MHSFVLLLLAVSAAVSVAAQCETLPAFTHSFSFAEDLRDNGEGAAWVMSLTATDGSEAEYIDGLTDGVALSVRDDACLSLTADGQSAPTIGGVTSMVFVVRLGAWAGADEDLFSAANGAVQRLRIFRTGGGQQLRVLISDSGGQESVLESAAGAVDGAVGDGRWLQVVLTAEADSSVSLYLNGVRVQTEESVTIPTAPRATADLRCPAPGAQTSNMTFDSFIVTDGALSADCVSRLYSELCNNNGRLSGDRTGCLCDAGYTGRTCSKEDSGAAGQGVTLGGLTLEGPVLYAAIGVVALLFIGLTVGCLRTCTANRSKKKAAHGSAATTSFQSRPAKPAEPKDSVSMVAASPAGTTEMTSRHTSRHVLRVPSRMLRAPPTAGGLTPGYVGGPPPSKPVPPPPSAAV